MEKISIIVPVYKVEEYLDRCLGSIVAQDYDDLEIILVDDGSPDNCPQICDAWAERDPRIRVIHKENGGISSARNAGIDAATGRYFYFVDSDDYIAPELCSRAMECFEKDAPDIVVFDSCRINKKGVPCGGTETLQDACLSQEQAIQAMLAGRMNSYAWNKVFKREVFDGVRFPEGRIWEDVAITPRLLLNAQKIRSIPDALYYYCEREGSIVAKITEKALVDIFLARYEGYLLLKQYSPDICAAAFSWVILAAMNLYDRSLWADVDRQILDKALGFLAEHRAAALDENKNLRLALYYGAPGLYRQLRLLKHQVGNMVKRFVR